MVKLPITSLRGFFLGCCLTKSARFLLARARHLCRSEAKRGNLSIVTKGGWTYILANFTRTTFYIGVTSDLDSRHEEHKSRIYPKSFTSRYNTYFLIYYNWHDSIEDAIDEEKRIKAGSRKGKLDLIRAKNPGLSDLSRTYSDR